MTPRVPVDAKTADWPRKVAQAINRLIGKSVMRDGQTIYTPPTISNPPTQAEVQAIADALGAVSDRLK